MRLDAPRTDLPRAEAPTVRLADYRPPDHLVDAVRLDVRLDGPGTRVASTLRLRANPAGRAGAPLRLDGDELVLESVVLDGAPLAAGAYAATPQGFVLHAPPAGSFELGFVTRLDPGANTKLMGLFRSGGTYVTQCEPEGFRRLTYYPDRPDVLSVFTTRIEADRTEAPVLLGNGDPIASGAVEGTDRHFAVWHDPHPKPAYLFALVGGDLDVVSDEFTTSEGRSVRLGVYVERGKAPRAAYAMDALKRSMRWDEQVFGRAYDLDVFNVVAVADFNMGAMENKGLNVFNDKYVLASPESATDSDYAGIEAVIAHEYFHNWTGNRITCRDWFQLCLKEGLTVYRDQEFSGDMRSRPVERIGDVRGLRAAQFAEDAGPLAHPVRPTAYREINNFYTATVYEKGAEVVRMLRLVVGDAAFKSGMDLYFDRCDGTAATVEDFLGCFAEVSGHDLSTFFRWYEQAGTPVVTVTRSREGGALVLDIAQATPATPGQPTKAPFTIPLALGLVGPDGAALPVAARGVRDDGVFVLEGERARLVLAGAPEGAVPSLLRGFSAPVTLALDLAEGELALLAAHDADPFNRWQALQSLGMRRLIALARGAGADAGEEDLIGALALALSRADEDPAFAALALALPGEGEVAREIGRDVDPGAIHAARTGLRARLGARLAPRLADLHDAMADAGPYAPDAAGAGRRALRNAALDLLVAGDPAAGAARARAQHDAATNMTECLGAIAALLPHPGPAREDLLAAFAARHGDDALALDKWFALNASVPGEEALARVRGLMDHPAFALANPNRARSLVGTFALANPSGFHRADGGGYELLVEVAERLDPVNPQVAARLLTAFRAWRTLEPCRAALARSALERLAARPGLSSDASDIVGRSLAG